MALKNIYTNKDTNGFFWCLGAVRFAREKEATATIDRPSNQPGRAPCRQ
jgi:hypothetical protein